MKRIESKEDKERREKRVKFVVGIVVIIVMLGSVFGAVVNFSSGGGSTGGGSQDNLVEEYKGQKFYFRQGYWLTPISGGNLSFRHLPKDTNDVEVGSSSLPSIREYQGETLYIHSDNDLAGSEIQRNMRQIALRVQPICIEGKNCESTNLPKKDCSDKTIILFNESKTKIRNEDQCTYIEGPDEELTKLADEFLFRSLGIK